MNIESNLDAKDVKIEMTRSGTWRITCQCPVCHHRNTHGGGRRDTPECGGRMCHAEGCTYHYNIPTPNKEI